MHRASSIKRGDTSIGERLFGAIHLLRQIAVNLPTPLRIRLADSEVPRAAPGIAAQALHTQRLIRAGFAHVGIHDLRFIDDDGSELSSFELLISRRIAEALEHRVDHFADPESVLRALALLHDRSVDGLPRGVVRADIEREAGLSIAAYASGQRDAPPVLLVLPCGMPLELCLDWLTLLSKQFYVVTWETRCLFGTCEARDEVRYDAAAQVEDLFAVLDHFEIDRPKVMGICGGAVIALCAALERRERIGALSLWYGDYNLGQGDLRTSHQTNFAWLMESAAEDREMARDLQRMFADPSALSNVPAAIAHAALYPYVNDELMYRYARLNDALNKVNLESCLGQLGVPALIVTGDCDETTHCGSSIFVAEAIPGAQLHIETGGSHPAFFGVPALSLDLAIEFFRTSSEPARV